MNGNAKGGNIMSRKEKRKCKNCIFATYHRGECIAACGYICHLNPFRPVALGLLGDCEKRKELKAEQYPKKKKDS